MLWLEGLPICKWYVKTTVNSMVKTETVLTWEQGDPEVRIKQLGQSNTMFCAFLKGQGDCANTGGKRASAPE